MKSINDIQDTIIADFETMEDNFSKYAHLLGFAGELPKMRVSEKIDSNLLQECQSPVWLDIRVINGLFYFAADCDAMIIKGILYLLHLILCTQPAREVAEAELDFLKRISVMDTLSLDRQKDVGVIIRTLQEKARLFLTNRKGVRRKRYTITSNHTFEDDYRDCRLISEI